MNRFFINKSDISNNSITLLGDNAHHASKVLRLKVGDVCVLCDGCGLDYVCTIKDITKNAVEFDINEIAPSVGESNIKVTLYQCYPKMSKMDNIIQKSVELGVYCIVPVISKFTVVNLSGKEQDKIMRLNKISQSAAMQCHRAIIPQIKQPLTLKQVCAQMQTHDLKLVAYEKNTDTPIKPLLKSTKNALDIGILVGSEGGFSIDEIELLSNSGIVPFTLGKRILRTETAPIAILSAIMYEFDNMK